MIGLALNAGCSRTDGRQYVTGMVKVNGESAARAQVYFVPLDGSPARPSAEVAPDGSFAMKGLDGAKPGEYYVTIVWPEYEVNGGEEVQLGDRLQGRYADAQKAFTKVTIVTGKNYLAPFELTLP